MTAPGSYGLRGMRQIAVRLAAWAPLVAAAPTGLGAVVLAGPQKPGDDDHVVVFVGWDAVEGGEYAAVDRLTQSYRGAGGLHRDESFAVPCAIVVTGVDDPAAPVGSGDADDPEYLLALGDVADAVFGEVVRCLMAKPNQGLGLPAGRGAGDTGPTEGRLLLELPLRRARMMFTVRVATRIG